MRPAASCEHVLWGQVMCLYLEKGRQFFSPRGSQLFIWGSHSLPVPSSNLPLSCLVQWWTYCGWWSLCYQNPGSVPKTDLRHRETDAKSFLAVSQLQNPASELMEEQMWQLVVCFSLGVGRLLPFLTLLSNSFPTKIPEGQHTELLIFTSEHLWIKIVDPRRSHSRFVPTIKGLYPPCPPLPTV